jgi:hypothetical protein
VRDPWILPAGDESRLTYHPRGACEEYVHAGLRVYGPLTGHSWNLT